MSPTSELVAQRQLNLANRAYNVIATTPGNAKGTISDVPVTRAKNMAVESVWNVNLKDDGLIFMYGCAFQDRKVLVEVALTSNVAQD